MCVQKSPNCTASQFKHLICLVRIKYPFLRISNYFFLFLFAFSQHPDLFGLYVIFGDFLACLFKYTFIYQVSADWERTSLRPSIQPSSVFKPSPVMETYTTEGGFINTNLVTADEDSQEFDDLIFALKTGEENYTTYLSTDYTGSKCQKHNLILNIPLGVFAALNILT